MTVGRYDGDAYHIRKIEAPYSEEQLRKVESELPGYERLIAEAIASTATASIT